MFDLEQAIGQYTLYRLLLNKVEPERKLYLGITNEVYDEVFTESIGELVIQNLPLQLVVVNSTTLEIVQWIPPNLTV